MNTEFMTEHPLRKTLTEDDWTRIKQAIETEEYDSVTVDEIAAFNDVLLDKISTSAQTHISILCLH